MIRSSSSPIKQMQYASKLKLIDTHIIRSDMGSNAVNLEYEQMLKIMALKLAIEPPQQILPFTAKTVIFDTFQTRSFIIRQQVAPKQNNFMLNVNTYVPIRLQVKINDIRPKIYSFQGSKAIQIYEQSFSEINVIATVQKTGIFSSVKFYLDLVQVQYNSPKKVNVNMRPNISKQLDQFIANNRGKSAEIIRNRSLTRNKQLMMRKTAVSFKPMKSIELVRSKSQFQNFQKKKSLYIKHVRKMSPARDRILKEHQQKYHLSKKEQMTQLALIIYTAKLGMIFYRARLKQAAQRVKQLKINMLCVDFIKIIKNKFRLKMTQKARLRMNFHHTMQFLPTMMRSTAIKGAKKVLLEALTPYMNYQTLKELGSNSQDYINSTLKIQKYAKMKSKQLRERIQLFIQILIKKEKIDMDRSRITKIVENYIVICRNKGIWTSKIYQFKQQLILLLRKNGVQ